MNRVIDELETENVHPEKDNIKVIAARIHNFRSLVWVDRYKLPFEETPFRPAIRVGDFIELADQLCL